jgi:hypothetical protein
MTDVEIAMMVRLETAIYLLEQALVAASADAERHTWRIEQALVHARAGLREVVGRPRE